MTTTISLDPRSDFLAKNVARAEPVAALSELIWNGLDADATRVDVELVRKDLAGGLSRIVVTDNGAGFPYDQAETYFGRLGGSWKRTRRQTHDRQRMVHGQEGKGRFKAFALGKVVEWDVCYLKDSKPHSFVLSAKSADLKQFSLSDEKPAPGRQTGVIVRIDDVLRDFKSLDSEAGIQELVERFAPYLMNYTDVLVSVGEQSLDPSEAIIDRRSLDLESIQDEDGNTHAISLDLIEWKRDSKRALYLCSKDGFPLMQKETRFQTGPYSFAAYLKCALFTELQNDGVLGVSEMSSTLDDKISEARQAIKDHFTAKSAEKARTIVEEWKDEEVYPFKGEARNPLEEVERQVFDMVAVTANKYAPHIETASKREKAYHLRMLRQALENSPSELQAIFKEVLELPAREQKELAELLRETSLSGIIAAAKTVADRLVFLEGLEHTLFDFEEKKLLKERTQLHKMLEQNTWLFGEEYNLWASDRGLKAVLMRHKQHLDPNVVIDDPVELVGKKVGIVDLVLSRQLQKSRKNDVENLVVELKAPTVKASQKELTQLKTYADAVENDERFHGISGVKWHFWLIVNDYDRLVERDIKGGNDPEKGVISDEGGVLLGVKRWSQVIQENRARLQFFQESLQHSVDDGQAVKKLRQRYAEFWGGNEEEEKNPAGEPTAKND